MQHMKIWNQVCKTDPKHTKKANVGGNKITCIAPQTQVKAATAVFGPYGYGWGWQEFSLDLSMIEFGLVIFKGTFFYHVINEKGETLRSEFPIQNSCKIYKDNAKTKIDDDFAKKIETDTLTKALSKLGFNSDVFEGDFDDSRYVQDRIAEEQAKDGREAKLVADLRQLAAELGKIDKALAGKIWDRNKSGEINTAQAIEEYAAALDAIEVNKETVSEQLLEDIIDEQAR